MAPKQDRKIYTRKQMELAGFDAEAIDARLQLQLEWMVEGPGAESDDPSTIVIRSRPPAQEETKPRKPARATGTTRKRIETPSVDEDDDDSVRELSPPPRPSKKVKTEKTREKAKAKAKEEEEWVEKPEGEECEQCREMSRKVVKCEVKAVGAAAACRHCATNKQKCSFTSRKKGGATANPKANAGSPAPSNIAPAGPLTRHRAAEAAAPDWPGLIGALNTLNESVAEVAQGLREFGEWRAEQKNGTLDIADALRGIGIELARQALASGFSGVESDSDAINAFNGVLYRDRDPRDDFVTGRHAQGKLAEHNRLKRLRKERKASEKKAKETEGAGPSGSGPGGKPEERKEDEEEKGKKGEDGKEADA